MHCRRVPVRLAVAIVALVAPARARAQTPARADTSATTPPQIVRVASRRLPFEARDLLLANCAWRAQDALGYLVPYLCVRHMSGTLERADADSVVFVRKGRSIRVAMRNVHALEQLNGRSRARAVAGGALGAAVGVVGAAFAGIGGAYKTDAEFFATAGALTIGGAIIGARAGGNRWTEWPRSYAPPAAGNE